jgi:hypothetical protein
LHAPVAARRRLIVAALTVIAAAARPATPRAMTMRMARLAEANTCPVTCRRDMYPTMNSATMADVLGA